MRTGALLLSLAVLIPILSTALTRDELAMFRDPAGWEYLTLSESNNGFQTQAACFDKAFTGACKGDLLFRSDGSFRQNVSAHGRSMHRGGHYQVQDYDLIFWDEHETKDGPYRVTMNLDQKTMTLETTQAGVGVKIELMLESEFKKRLRERQKQAAPH